MAFCLSLFNVAVGQNSNSSVLIKRFDFNLNLIKGKLIADSLSLIYSDSSFVVLNELMNDSIFMNSLIKTNHDQLICSTYKIPSFIKPLGWTSDYEHIFSADEISKLDSILDKFEKQTTNEIAVLTFDSSYLKNENFDNLVISIHNFWHIGKNVKNNGILIGISTKQKKIRISNGYGIEAKLSDYETKKIIDNVIIPEFKKGNYFTGLTNAILELMQK
ncbi:MAG: TPM domain-containing protein, partial [Bacteroidota bacterium]|nr:TPM domain-containing protein [Bacteroidota bacterium]